MRVLTDAKARSESLVEQLGGQVEEAQVTSCPVSIILLLLLSLLLLLQLMLSLQSAVCNTEVSAAMHVQRDPASRRAGWCYSSCSWRRQQRRAHGGRGRRQSGGCRSCASRQSSCWRRPRQRKRSRLTPSTACVLPPASCTCRAACAGLCAVHVHWHWFVVGACTVRLFRRRTQATAAQKRIRELVASVKAERLLAAKALTEVQRLERQWTASSSAAHRVEADVSDGAAPTFTPVIGQKVAVRSIGGSVGTITAVGSKVPVLCVFCCKSTVASASVLGNLTTDVQLCRCHRDCLATSCRMSGL